MNNISQKFLLLIAAISPHYAMNNDASIQQEFTQSQLALPCKSVMMKDDALETPVFTIVSAPHNNLKRAKFFTRIPRILGEGACPEYVRLSEVMYSPLPDTKTLSIAGQYALKAYEECDILKIEALRVIYPNFNLQDFYPNFFWNDSESPRAQYTRLYNSMERFAKWREPILDNSDYIPYINFSAIQRNRLNHRIAITFSHSGND